MHSNKGKLILILVSVLILGFTTLLHSRSVNGGSGGDKRLDIFHWHNVGNIWMRVSNYGFFGSGDDVTPQWPSLEYPGGSGIDYLYQGALWFGAKKIRRNEFYQILYWLDPSHTITCTTNMGFGQVIDTLCTVGFDGDSDYYEFLPAYNPLEKNALGQLYDANNIYDGMLQASIREHLAGVDDDGDGLVDEDMPGFTFPFRSADELPTQFSAFSDLFPADFPENASGTIDDNKNIWFPLGFMVLGYEDPDSIYCFAKPYDDDGDGLKDEDGAPISEQDYIAYYYDYSPFGTPGNRTHGSSSGTHYPLEIRVRQISFQWSYEYIKNLIYVEFDITNMHPSDTLYDCTMGVYMDCDVGPQAWGNTYSDDISSYVAGSGYEFAYTYDADKDGGLTTGYVATRVCTPDPELLDFACWTWDVGDGPDDEERYWLMTHNTESIDPQKWISLREFPETQLNDPCDTRYLFAFYGDMHGVSNPTSGSWNLGPGRTMKIVIGIFPGDDIPELQRTALWAKDIYGEAQTLTTVILPDTFKHYDAPGPPDSPKMTLTQATNGDSIMVYWNNCSEFSYDVMTVSKGLIGYQNEHDFLPSYKSDIDTSDSDYNAHALVDPATGNRLRHDFQGYSIWIASNSGEQDAYVRKKRWDKIDTPQDLRDYSCCLNLPDTTYEVDFGGYLGINAGLPLPYEVGSNEGNDIIYISEYGDTIRWTNYYKLDTLFLFAPVCIGDIVYGIPLYAAHVDSTIKDSQVYIELQQITDEEIRKEKEALLFKNPNIEEDDIYLALYSDKLIPLPLHLGQHLIYAELREERLASRYYKHTILYPEKGVENYVAVTTFDRGIPDKDLESLESGRDANRITIFPGPGYTSDMDKIYVVPNPYLGLSKFDGRREGDEKGDKSKRIWFVNLPEDCTIKIFTLAGDLVDVIEHRGAYEEDVINPSKATHTGITSSGMHSWDMLSKNNQIIASGVYLYSVKDHATKDVKIDKFVLIK